MKYLICLIFLFTLISCGKLTETTGFTGNPTEVSQEFSFPSSYYCDSNENGEYEEGFKLQDAGVNKGRHVAEGGGCILANINEVWKATRQPEPFKWYRTSRAVPVLRDDDIAGIEYFYEVFMENRDFVRVRWTLYWLHSVQRGSLEEPSEILINYEKVAGTRFIKHWKGSIILEKLTENVTSLRIVHNIDAMRTSYEDAVKGVTKYYNDLSKLSKATVETAPLQ